ncbi:MAG: hypothetical protein WCV85_06405 [Patescibacteria group bacterium]|jgi:hypothetical protein
MIPQKLLDEVVAVARQQAVDFGTPPFPQTEYISIQGQNLVKKHGANGEIVLVGTYLMDVMLGKALAEGQREEHIQWGEDIATKLFLQYSEMTIDEKENILLCIRQHHGGVQFQTIEAEICCNADCYRFLSVQGMLIGLTNSRKMPIDALVKLYKEKVEEKWHALTLPDCKTALLPQYQAIAAMLRAFV